MKKVSAFILAALLFVPAVFGQSADKMTDVLKSGEVTLGQACYFFATASENVKDNISYEKALEYFKERSVIDSSCSENDKASLGSLALLANDVFNIQGSLCLSLFKTGRYAYRQMKADGVFSRYDDPALIPNGHKFFSVLTRCLDKYELRSAE
ncbi:MAG: hypothetical protein J5780_07025 [Treponema sp.]|nr:hypothetical protein [Treponema sp.]